MASSEIASEASLRNNIDCSSSEQRGGCSDVLSDALSGEGHICHFNRVLRRCHPEQSSCSGEFGCRSFVKLPLSSLFTICHVKKLACFCEPQFGQISLNISPPHSVLETKNLQAKVLDSTFPTIFKFVNNCRIRTLMGFEL